jgi:mono/diheme cytochrome c family protein
MRRSVIVVVAALGVGALAPAPAAWSGGREVFLGEKCDTCHDVAGAGIQARVQVPAAKGPALPTAQLASDDELRSYLRRQTERNGKRHPTGFAGDDTALAALLAWLRELDEGSRGAPPEPGS